MANRFNVWPEQIGPLLPGDGVAGVWLTVTVALPEDAPPEQPEASVTAVTAYTVVELGLTVRKALGVLTPFCM